MKYIYETEYKPYMGILIDVRDPITYQKEHHPNSINIYYDKLLLNYNKYLDKNKKYYFICNEGHLSKKAARILSYYGYDVTYVVNSK